VLARPLAANGYRVSCVEPDPDLRVRLTRAGLGVHGGLHEIPPESFDFIYTVNVLEHIPDDDVIVGALRTRLKPGGVLLVYVPAFPLLYSSMDRKVGHVRRYRHGRLLGVMRAIGRDVLREEPSRRRTPACLEDLWSQNDRVDRGRRSPSGKAWVSALRSLESYGHPRSIVIGQHRSVRLNKRIA